MISVENIYKTFNKNTVLENPVLRGLSLSLDSGEFACIIGSNGAGKSSLLNAIAGEISLDSGCIKLDGEDINSLNLREKTRKVARVFQDPLAGTCPTLTIAENLSLAMKRGGRRRLFPAVKSRYLKRFKDNLALLNLGLENRLDDKMGLLSGGQRQAVSLLMASLRPSSILLLDEHTAALDPKTAAFVLDLTKNIVEEKKLTTLMITHSMQQALDYGSRTIMLHQGKVVFDIDKEKRKNLKVADLLALFERENKDFISDKLIFA